MTSYTTVKSYVSVEYSIKKSSFIGHIYPVTEAEEAKLIINDLNEKYSDANHNCYGYVLGVNANIQKFDDDGEPGGTAGMPIVQVLLKNDIVDCLIVVTRYFGGIKLGAGGLVRAYTKAAAMALDKAERITMVEGYKSKITLDYSLQGKADFLLRNKGYEVINTAFTHEVEFLVKTINPFEELENLIRELSQGKGKCEKLGNIFIPSEDKKVE